MNNTKALIIILVTIVTGIILRLDVFTLPIQGRDAWRQSKTGWNIRYFVREDANIFNPRRPYLNDGDNIERYEFPLLQWSLAMVQKVTGEYIFVMRLMVYLISLLTLFAVYRIAMLFTDNQVTSAVSLFAFAFLPTFFYNSTSIMPDSLALCFSMYYVLFFSRYIKSKKPSDLYWSALFIALAGLVKLPYILLGAFSIIGFIDLWTTKEPGLKREWIRLFIANILALVPVLTWYGIFLPGWKGNNIAAGFTKDFVGWPLFLDFLKNHFLVNFPMEILNFPALILLMVGVYHFITNKKVFFLRSAYFFFPLLVLFLYFLYIVNVIREGHDYYLMPFYPIFLLALILGIHKALQWKPPFRIIALALILAMPVVCWTRVKNYWDISQAYFNNDFFTCRDQLSAIGGRDDRVIVINDQSLAIYFYIIDKTGYCFWNDHLPVLWIKGLAKNEKVKYLFSDSRIIESQEGFEECISDTILVCGTVKVFRLKDPGEIKI